VIDLTNPTVPDATSKLFANLFVFEPAGCLNLIIVTSYGEVKMLEYI